MAFKENFLFDVMRVGDTNLSTLWEDISFAMWKVPFKDDLSMASVPHSTLT